MKRWLATLMLAGATFILPAFAQEHEGKAAEGAEEEHEGGMEIWKVANFVILFGVLYVLIRKNAAPLLVARSKEIQDGLAAGEKAKADAEARAAAVALRMSGLEKEIAGLRDSARAEREHEAERIMRETQNEINRLRQHATMEIESASKQARLDVQRHAAKLALDLAEKKVRERMSAATQAGLVDTFVTVIGKGAR